MPSNLVHPDVQFIEATATLPPLLQFLSRETDAKSDLPAPVHSSPAPSSSQRFPVPPAAARITLPLPPQSSPIVQPVTQLKSRNNHVAPHDWMGETFYGLMENTVQRNVKLQMQFPKVELLAASRKIRSWDRKCRTASHEDRVLRGGFASVRQQPHEQPRAKRRVNGIRGVWEETSSHSLFPHVKKVRHVGKGSRRRRAKPPRPVSRLPPGKMFRGILPQVNFNN